MNPNEPVSVANECDHAIYAFIASQTEDLKTHFSQCKPLVNHNKIGKLKKKNR